MMTVTVENRLRRSLFILAAFIFLGTLVELWLEEHTEETIQLLPFFLCSLGIIAIAVALARPQRTTLLILRVAMALNAAGGLVGTALHLYNNFLFEQEIRPNAAASELVMSTLQGANPLLAPGILVFAALMVLIATYAHPVLGGRDKTE
jgi:hypothetical protein